MLKKHIVCLGDSNTHGYCADFADSADGALGRFNEEERWTCLLQKKLGDSCLVIEEGFGGRTTVFRDPLREGTAAIDYLYPCLKSHEKVSLLIIMLGTNDTKERFGANATCIGLGMERLVRKARATDCWVEGKPNILIVCPPPIGDEMESSPMGGSMGKGCAAKAQALSPVLKATAALTECSFHDAADCELNCIDYMHLSRKGHAQLAESLSILVPKLL